MAKKQEEDNRDIFDKALDAVPVVTMIGGAVAGAKGARAAAGMRNWKKVKRELDGAMARGDKAASKRLYEEYVHTRSQSIPARAIGGYVGAHLGNESGRVIVDAAGQKKRRK